MITPREGMETGKNTMQRSMGETKIGEKKRSHGKDRRLQLSHTNELEGRDAMMASTGETEAKSTKGPWKMSEIVLMQSIKTMQ